MKQCIRVLIVEDQPDDAELMVLRLNQEDFEIEWDRVQTESDYLAALDDKPDLILADWSLPQFSGMRALELINDRDLDIPFILVSGSIGEEAAIDALHHGAYDYVLKDRSKRLGRSAKRALESRRYQQEKELAEINLKKRLVELESLFSISNTLRFASNLAEMLRLLLDETLKSIDSDSGGIWLCNSSDHLLRLEIAKGWHLHFNDDYLKPGEGITGKVFTSNQLYVCREYANDKNANSKIMPFVPRGWGGVCLPIQSGNEAIGVLDVSVELPREIITDDIKLLSSITEMAGIAIHRISLFEKLQSAGEALASAYDQTIKGWADALELRDLETEGHSERVAELTVAIAREMGIEESKIEHIYRGSLLHDIGKMGVPDTILLKPGSLTEREWEIMRKHPQYAYEMLSPIVYLEPALNIPYCHHEKYDGSGYPRGLKGEEIPLEARIFAVVDVFDALTSDRPYRKAWSRVESLEYIKKESNKHFDPQLVVKFMYMLDKQEQV